MPKLKINGSEIEVAAGTSILQAAEMLGHEIPRFCYHDKLSVPANCRMCLVEVKGAPKPVASCAMACGENMEVMTDSPMVKKARNGVMEMLLINHPLDCPICDQGGECDLQDQAMGYGYDRSRYQENKRAVKDKNIGPLIKTVMTRCIHCTRCVRFGEEIGGVADLGLLNRGENVEIGTFVQKAVGSELSGNMIDICPVGALTSKPYAFQARPWELRKTETIDVQDALGCNIRVDSRGNEVMRILPRLHEGINEEWINDRTRFSYDGLKRQRLDRPFVRDDVSKKLRPATWDEAFTKVAEKINSTKPENCVALVGGLSAAEDIFALKKWMQSLGVVQIDAQVNGLRLDASKRENYLFNTSIAGIEQADAILLVGTNPRWEATLVNARIRKTWLQSRCKVAAIGAPVDLTYPVQFLGAEGAALDAVLSGQSPFAEKLKTAKNPMIIVGAGCLDGEQGVALHSLCFEIAKKYNMIREDWNGFNVLHLHAAQVTSLDLGLRFVETRHLQSAHFVYILNADDSRVQSISPQAFVVYQGHHGDVGASRADVILPAATFTEKDGLYVNTEGRVQMAKKAVSPVGEAREDWKILRALSDACGKSLGYDNLYQVRQALIADHPHFAAIDQVPRLWAPDVASGKASSIGTISYPLTNFYLTNVISKASMTMAQCASAFSVSPSMAQAAE
jgi:NADH-quinone oxidoreductase subunit G